MRIHKLDETVIQRIAAGEVVQRPASAIKELIENSLDAGADNIVLTVLEGGFKSFTVQDNGHGILKTDLPLLCERYATSKLNTIEDLRDIQTFGFRGEALASISHVARITITTRSNDSSVGYKVSYLDGKMIGEPQATAANPGTTIVVQDLFYNNPVRRTGLGRPTEEYSRILEVVQRYALARHADCGFTVRKTVSSVDLVTKVGTDPVDIVRLIWGTLVASALQPVVFGDWANGLVSSAYHQQKTFTFILFINGRLVESARIKRAISTLYAEVLLAGAHPFVFLSLRLPGTGVDVNVHPTKREVILLHEDEIIGKLTTGIKDLLSQKGHIPGDTPAIKTKSVADTNILTQTAALKVGGAGDPYSLPSTLASSAIESSSPTIPTALPPPPSSAVSPSASSVSASRPFRQVHTDHKRRTLDSFIYDQQQQRAKTNGQGESMGLCEISPKEIKKPERVKAGLSQEMALKTLRRDSSAEATEIISRHTLVGWLDEHRIFIQCDTALLLVNIRELTREWLGIVMTCGRHATAAAAASFPLQECLEIFLRDHPQAADVDPESLIREITEVMQVDRPTWEALAGIRIDRTTLIGLPSLPEFATIDKCPVLIGQLIFRLAVDCDLETEDAFPLICSALCDYFLDSASWSNHQWVEHTLLPALRKPPIPYSGTLLHSGTLLKVATTYDLYRVFERC